MRRIKLRTLSMPEGNSFQNWTWHHMTPADFRRVMRSRQTRADRMDIVRTGLNALNAAPWVYNAGRAAANYLRAPHQTMQRRPGKGQGQIKKYNMAFSDRYLNAYRLRKRRKMRSRYPRKRRFRRRYRR